MWLVLAKIEIGLLEAVRADPRLLDNVLGDGSDGEVGPANPIFVTAAAQGRAVVGGIN